MITLNNIVNTIKAFATAHSQINSSFFAMLPDNDKDEPLIYPMLFFELTSGGVAENSETFVFDFMVVNQPKRDDRTSVQEVLSDTKQMANDVIAYLVMQNQDFFTDKDYTLEPIIDASDDSVTGWKWSLSIRLNQGLDSCVIPATTTPENNSSKVLIVDRAGNIVAELFAGMTYVDLSFKMVYSTTTLTTLTPDVDNYDEFVLTAQASGLTIANPIGTPYNGQIIAIRLKDNGTARAVSFGSDYVFLGTTYTTTTLGKVSILAARWSSDRNKWEIFASITEA